jgi:hypothetical protein
VDGGRSVGAGVGASICVSGRKRIIIREVISRRRRCRRDSRRADVSGDVKGLRNGCISHPVRTPPPLPLFIHILPPLLVVVIVVVSGRRRSRRPRRAILPQRDLRIAFPLPLLQHAHTHTHAQKRWRRRGPQLHRVGCARRRRVGSHQRGRRWQRRGAGCRFCFCPCLRSCSC